MSITTSRFTRRLGAALMLSLAVAACEDEVQSPPVTGIATEVGSLRLTLGTGQTLTLFDDGRITLSPLLFTRPNTSITVALLDRSDNVMNVSADLVRVNIGSGSNNVVSFARLGAFDGTLNGGNNPGSTQLQVGLFDLTRRKYAFGPYPVPIVVR